MASVAQSSLPMIWLLRPIRPEDFHWTNIFKVNSYQKSFDGETVTKQKMRTVSFLRKLSLAEECWQLPRLYKGREFRPTSTAWFWSHDRVSREKCDCHFSTIWSLWNLIDKKCSHSNLITWRHKLVCQDITFTFGQKWCNQRVAGQLQWLQNKLSTFQESFWHNATSQRQLGSSQSISCSFDWISSHVLVFQRWEGNKSFQANWSRFK